VIIYLTYNDQPSGVYWSQVTDVVAHLNTLGGPRVRLVALVSPRGFRGTRRAIKDRSPDALVLPMVPRMRNWRRNTAWLAWLCRLLRPSGILARGPFATWMGLRMRDRGLVAKVGFDGRGAYAAEWSEYRLVDDERLIADAEMAEREAVLRSDVRLAVSAALVDHWRERYGYADDAHVVVPCTLGSAVLGRTGADADLRRGSGWGEQDMVLVYSGSTAGWQSFALLEALLEPLLRRDPTLRVLFLSQGDPHVEALRGRFPGQVEQRWIGHDRVGAVLGACDAGLLVREPTVTNRVASPTKFGEYLSAGLPVLISSDLGDFSALVEQEDLGWVYHPEGTPPRPERLDAIARERLRNFARRHFTKEGHDAAYRELLVALDP
jgi:hypothetical protein